MKHKNVGVLNHKKGSKIQATNMAQGRSIMRGVQDKDIT